MNLTIETLDGLIKHNGPVKNIQKYKNILNKDFFNKNAVLIFFGNIGY